MLPDGWVDKGFRFYERVGDRGPKDGLNTHQTPHLLMH
jgi:hypothetical protein